MKVGWLCLLATAFMGLALSVHILMGIDRLARLVPSVRTKNKGNNSSSSRSRNDVAHGFSHWIQPKTTSGFIAFTLLFGLPGGSNPYDNPLLALFLSSVSNIGYDVVLVGEPAPSPELRKYFPPNVHFFHVTWEQVFDRLSKKTHGESYHNLANVNRYKAIDLKPVIPWLFPELVSAFEYFAWTDNDMFFGGKMLEEVERFRREKIDHATSLEISHPYRKSHGPFSLWRVKFYTQRVVPLLEGEQWQPVIKRVFHSNISMFFEEWGQYRMPWVNTFSALVDQLELVAQNSSDPTDSFHRGRVNPVMDDGDCLALNAKSFQPPGKLCYCRAVFPKYETTNRRETKVPTRLYGADGQEFALCHFHRGKKHWPRNWAENIPGLPVVGSIAPSGALSEGKTSRNSFNRKSSIIVTAKDGPFVADLGCMRTSNQTHGSGAGTTRSTGDPRMFCGGKVE